jgi:hypothetical protein
MLNILMEVGYIHNTVKCMVYKLSQYLMFKLNIMFDDKTQTYF